MEDNSLKDLTTEELQVYDRQRFIGVEVQKRLVNSNVFLTPMNGSNTELAKNLILCGVNITICDDSIITNEDLDQNFLFGHEHLGKKKCDVASVQFNQMNPMVKIHKLESFNITEIYQKFIEKKEVSKQNSDIDFLRKFDIIALSTSNFSEMFMWDAIARLVNKPLYILVSAGLYGFFFVDLGLDFKYTKESVDKNSQKKIAEDCQLSCSELQKCLRFDKKSSKNNLVYYAILMMYKAFQNNIHYDIYDTTNQENLKKLDQIVGFAEEICSKHKINLDDTAKFFFKNFVRLYGLEYCATYSIIGSVASQEFIKVIGKNVEPIVNWFCYDSQIGYGKFEQMQQEQPINCTKQQQQQKQSASKVQVVEEIL